MRETPEDSPEEDDFGLDIDDSAFSDAAEANTMKPVEIGFAQALKEGKLPGKEEWAIILGEISDDRQKEIIAQLRADNSFTNEKAEKIYEQSMDVDVPLTGSLRVILTMVSDDRKRDITREAMKKLGII